MQFVKNSGRTLGVTCTLTNAEMCTSVLTQVFTTWKFDYSSHIGDVFTYTCHRCMSSNVLYILMTVAHNRPQGKLYNAKLVGHSFHAAKINTNQCSILWSSVSEYFNQTVRTDRSIATGYVYIMLDGVFSLNIQHAWFYMIWFTEALSFRYW